jgi:hypothetical protein
VEHGGLVVQRGDLDLLGAVTAPGQDEELADPAQDRHSKDQHTSEDALYPRMLKP